MSQVSNAKKPPKRRESVAGFQNLKGQAHSTSVKVHSNSFLYSPELYLSNITQNYSNIKPEAISSDRMMGGLDTADRGSSAALRHRLNHDNGPPYFQPSSPSRHGVIINNYSAIIIGLTTAGGHSGPPLHKLCLLHPPQKKGKKKKIPTQATFSRDGPLQLTHTFPQLVLKECVGRTSCTQATAAWAD